jgi:HSP20 family protein
MAEAITKLPIKTDSKTPVPATQTGQSWAPLETLRREIDRIFDSFHRGSLAFPFAQRAFEFELPSLRGMVAGIAPAVDVTEKDKEYEITAELPGLDEKNIEIKLANGMLTIKGEKKEEKEEKEKDYYLSERHYGSFTRSFQLPESVDTAKIEASFTKGVLTVKLPKSAEAQKNEKTIPVKAA